MWVIMPSVELGEAATADWASAWRVGGSKTYHRSYETSQMTPGIMRNLVLAAGEQDGRKTYLNVIEVIPHGCKNGDYGRAKDPFGEVTGIIFLLTLSDSSGSSLCFRRSHR